ncbi:DUF4230 domain-containing protein [Maribacter polysiphoniae]|uniref:DUF4230 domain-containing protein n=1 Tax=Maribacter polysiphoniae TaxID=429344 RepID=A0A316E7A1_9FLAO|nr:DUF4230 domain-containing protein [Maribacter polysiphoniae]MBD1263078.1 DUF4230 domain-containing protein [Maribacter polysiphoniae]PWK18830.1 uncharacterized protein DUF4230 [Maribacter polysiphoniae]
MKRILIGALVTLSLVLVVRSCWDDREKKSILKENSMLIQQQIDNVSKLIVTEGHFAEVYTYKDSQELFGALITADKKALVVVNAEVLVTYDLGKIDFEVDELTKTLRIKSIPEPEIKINPDFEYYDVSADYLNPFNASDYNTIKRNVQASLMKKIEASSLRSNAENRLISELSKFYILTNSMGWTLVYGDRNIEDMDGLRGLDKFSTD